MEGSAHPPPPVARTGPGFPRLGLGVLWAAGGLLTLACIAAPAGSAAWAMLGSLPGSLGAAVPDGRVLASSALWAGAIATIATAAGWPAAWAARGRGWGLAMLLLIAALMPPYLAYSGWGLLRAPGTQLGDGLARLGQGGAAWAPVWFGRGLAVLGLGLWAAPLAAIMMLPSALSVDGACIEQARLDAPRRRRRWLLILALTRGGVARAWGLVWLVGLGSAVPLHLAQIETATLRVWRALDGFDGGHAGSAIVAAWPVLAAGLVGAVLLARAAWDPPAAWAGAGERPSRLARGLTVVLVLAAVLGPLLLFAGSLRSASSLAVFWRVSGREVMGSLSVAGLVATGAMVLALAGWTGGSSRSPVVRRVTGVALGLWLLGALTPGVIVGRALLWSWSWWEWLADSPAILAMAHLARFGAVAALAGFWLGRTEPAEHAAQRALDGADGLGSWARATDPSRFAAAAASALAVGALSLHEIEASIFVQPPGLGSLPRTMLQHLHYNRTEDLCAAGVWVVGTGMALALASAAAARIAARGRPGPPRAGRA